MKLCKVCQKVIPEKRVSLGYEDTCVDHSETFKYVGFVAGASKTEYQVSIVKDRDTAQHMKELYERRG